MNKVVYKGKPGSIVDGVTFTVCHYKSKTSPSHVIIESLTKSTNSMWRDDFLMVSRCEDADDPMDKAWEVSGFDRNLFDMKQ
jgi:hypothetical protein